MIRLKGGESEASRIMNRALGGGKGTPEGDLVDKRGGRGTIEPTPLARNLGMPSAMKERQMRAQPKDWSHSSNRIALGAPVYMQSKTRVDAEFEDRGHEDDEPRPKLGDADAAFEAGKLDALSDEDDEFGEGDEGGAVAQWREARLAELRKKATKTNEFLGLGHGSYTEIVQDDFLKEVTKSKYVVCHFYHPEYERCKLVDKHLEQLARKHLATKWIKIDANKAPFFVGKLQIRMLPTIVFFKDGIARDRMTGLDDMGDAGEEFTTAQLEARIAKAGVIITGDKIDHEELENQKKTANSIRQSKHSSRDSDDDDDDE